MKSSSLLLSIDFSIYTLFKFPYCFLVRIYYGIRFMIHIIKLPPTRYTQKTKQNPMIQYDLVLWNFTIEKIYIREFFFAVIFFFCWDIYTRVIPIVYMSNIGVLLYKLIYLNLLSDNCNECLGPIFNFCKIFLFLNTCNVNFATYDGVK